MWVWDFVSTWSADIHVTRVIKRNLVEVYTNYYKLEKLILLFVDINQFRSFILTPNSMFYLWLLITVWRQRLLHLDDLLQSSLTIMRTINRYINFYKQFLIEKFKFFVVNGPDYVDMYSLEGVKWWRIYIGLGIRFGNRFGNSLTCPVFTYFTVC